MLRAHDQLADGAAFDLDIVVVHQARLVACAQTTGGAECALVALGGTNHGTITASFCSQTSCVEMRYLSRFVNSLNSGDESWGTPRYATWWTSCDEAIYPQNSAVIAGAVNTKTACMKHSQLKENATVYAQVKALVAQQ